MDFFNYVSDLYSLRYKKKPKYFLIIYRKYRKKIDDLANEKDEVLYREYIWNSDSLNEEMDSYYIQIYMNILLNYSVIKKVNPRLLPGRLEELITVAGVKRKGERHRILLNVNRRKFTTGDKLCQMRTV